eukprot:TRINITY_DN3290_c0_g1_i1.p1 TRINITY_DN3290_c0_g1~~TRINITY_DN3290_c0_g1_i1.p1  ORF type:complete len:494 (+),score=38.90 TRINITY_DN3290_c0_g1_i1:388-1869(+)
MELITNPKLIFLDEPTSGLDSFAAKTVMDSLRTLAFMGRTIICSIHQPSAEIYRMFDQLVLLGEGQTVYFGSIEQCIPYFSTVGLHCPPYRNPADFLMQILYVAPTEDGDHNEELALKNTSNDQVKTMIKSFKKTEFHQRALNPPEPPSKISDFKKDKTANSFTQFGLLFTRSWLGLMREPMQARARFMQAAFLAIFAGLIYLRLGYDQTSIQDRFSAIFFIMVSTAFGGINAPTYLFPAERSVYLRERASGMYTPHIYFLARSLSELPINVIVPVLTGVVSWWLIGWSNDIPNFIYFLIIVTLCTNVAVSLGLSMSCWIHDVALVVRVQPMILLPFMLFSGFFLNVDSVRPYFLWLEKISFFKYSMSAATKACFAKQTFCCDFREQFRILENSTTFLDNTTMLLNNFTMVLNNSLSIADQSCNKYFNKTTLVPNGTMYGNQTLICPILDGEQVLQVYSFAKSTIFIDCMILLGMLLFFQFLAYLGLALKRGK